MSTLTKIGGGLTRLCHLRGRLPEFFLDLGCLTVVMVLLHEEQLFFRRSVS